jgi:hypothetical protein
MAAYASFDDVAARAGRFAGVFQVAGKHPDQTDIEAFLDDTAAEIDSSITSIGFVPGDITADAKASLVDLNAYGALARALSAANLGPQAAALLTEARSMWDLGIAAILDGSASIVVLLQSSSAGPSAGDLWSEDSTYGSRVGLQAEELALWDTNLAPVFRRGQSL